MPGPSRIAVLVSVAGGILTAIAVLLPPVLYFLFAYQHAAGQLEAEAGRDRTEIGRLIEANPTLWTYEHVRIGEILARSHRPPGQQESRRVLDLRGGVIAEQLAPLPAPRLSRALPLHDAGVRVGTIEVSRSLRPLLVRTVLALLALLPLGLVALHVLRTVPLRAVEESERALRRERDTARKYLEVAGVAFVALDAAGRVQLLNRKGGELLGLPVEQALGRDWVAEFVHPSSRARVAEQLAATRAGAVTRLDYDVVRPSGERRETSWYLTPLGEGPAEGLLASGLDETDHRRLEDQLRQAQKMEAVGRLAGGVAHEFNNILAAIRGHASLVLDEMPADAPQRQDVAEILAASERARHVTRSLLAFSCRQVFRPERVDLTDVVGRAERYLRPLLHDGLELRVVAPGEPLPVLADTGQLEQLLVNLVTNARDATPSGGRIVVSASRLEVGEQEATRAGLAHLGAYARIAVTDTGVGIEPAMQSRVFDPFFTTKRIGEGTGLGLAIAHGIVQQHGGALSFSSEPAGGTTFTFLLPLAEPEPLEAVGAGAAP